MDENKKPSTRKNKEGDEIFIFGQYKFKKINLNQKIIINNYKIDNLEIFRDENNYDILLNKYNFNFYCFKIFKI